MIWRFRAAFLLRIQEVLSSNLGLKTSHPEALRQPLQSQAAQCLKKAIVAAAFRNISNSALTNHSTIPRNFVWTDVLINTYWSDSAVISAPMFISLHSARICVPQCPGVGSHTQHRDYRCKLQRAEPFLKKVKLTLFTTQRPTIYGSTRS